VALRGNPRNLLTRTRRRLAAKRNGRRVAPTAGLLSDGGQRSNAGAMLQIFAQGDCDGSEVMIDPRFPDVGRPTFQDMRSLDEEFVIVRAWRRGRGQTA
jgi:hypothetical protein